MTAQAGVEALKTVVSVLTWGMILAAGLWALYSGYEAFTSMNDRHGASFKDNLTKALAAIIAIALLFLLKGLVVDPALNGLSEALKQ